MKLSSGSLLVAGLLSLTVLMCAITETNAAEPELRPSQKLMQARAAWVKSMTENLAAKKFDLVKADATALAGQTGTVAQKLDNPLAKELTLKVSTQATALATAVGAKNEAAATASLGDIKATCGECHAKIRDKK
jgi:hypothetical protein